MYTLTTEDIFKDNICIFVDASIVKTQPSYIGCPGCVVVYNGQEIYTDYIKLDATNSRSELSAVQLGIEQALKYRHLGKHINLFSDSKVCIYSIREWIFKWCNNIKNGVLYGSAPTPVLNQDIIINIINTILYNNLNINLFHQKGHVNINKQESLDNAKKVFIESNKIDLEMNLLKTISYYNNYVDIVTKNTLNMNTVQNKTLSDPIKFSLDGFDKYKYKQLIRINL